MTSELNEEAKAIIAEEENLLVQVEQSLEHQEVETASTRDFNQELLELRDEIVAARIEDKPQLLEQYDRLEALSKQNGKGISLPIDPKSPYFGHLRIKENGRSRDILIGKHTYNDAENNIRIVDWRNSPVAQIYYTYQEGEDFYEEINGREREGLVEVRRTLTIEKAVLNRVDNGSVIYVKKKDGWVPQKKEIFALSGAQGSAPRPQPVNQLGIGSDNRSRTSTQLQEITSLLDKEQYKLISNDDPGIMVIKGSAGSGKTTVALHRVSHLVFNDRHRYTPERVLLIVANQSLANYTSQVLPSMGIKGMKAVTYQSWASTCRQRIVKDLTDRYNEDTPVNVSRFKRHPMIIKAIVEQGKRRMNRLDEELRSSMQRRVDGQLVLQGWEAMGKLSYEQRRQSIMLWLKGEHDNPKLPRIKGLNAGTAQAAIAILERYPYGQRRLIQDWAEIITDKKLLERLVAENAPGEFSVGAMEEIARWNKELYEHFIEEPVVPEDVDDPEDEEEGLNPLDFSEQDIPTLDYEDDTIMLALFQHNVGRLPKPGGRLEYNHLMVDEVQDFTPLEVRVLLRTTTKEATITLAGDDAQAIVEESAFKSWDYFLSQLGAQHVTMTQLEVAYRSTAEIMEVAQAVLGKDPENSPKVTRHGMPVQLHKFSERGEAVDFVSKALRDLMMREPLCTVAVIARYPEVAELYYEALKKADVPRLRLVSREDFIFKPGIDVTDVREVKGLEFDYVIMVDVNSDTYGDDSLARNYLHVGLTRASGQLWCIATREPSSLLPKWLTE